MSLKSNSTIAARLLCAGTLLLPLLLTGCGPEESASAAERSTETTSSASRKALKSDSNDSGSNQKAKNKDLADPEKIINAYIDAINARDIEKALTFVIPDDGNGDDWREYFVVTDLLTGEKSEIPFSTGLPGQQALPPLHKVSEEDVKLYNLDPGEVGGVSVTFSDGDGNQGSLLFIKFEDGRLQLRSPAFLQTFNVRVSGRTDWETMHVAHPDAASINGVDAAGNTGTFSLMVPTFKGIGVSDFNCPDWLDFSTTWDGVTAQEEPEACWVSALGGYFG